LAVIRQPMIELRGVWKIFGVNARSALAAIRGEGIDKAEVLRRFECVIAVADANITIEASEIFCIMGLSGSGKSTLVRHINRLIDPTEGEVYIEAENIRRLGALELRQLRSRKLGMVFQNMALLPHRTVRDNVAFPLELRGVDRYERSLHADDILEKVQLGKWGDRYPRELSGGMQQRVGLARALAANPDILLMDEPFSALDPVIRRQLQDEFLALSRVLRKTTVFITHDLDEAIRLGSRIAIMKDGRIVQIGTPEGIVTQPADQYVADFVKGISRLQLVTARSVMRPIDEIKSLGVEQYPCAPPDADLKKLIALMLGSDLPILVRQDSQVLGYVDKNAILRCIYGQDSNA